MAHLINLFTPGHILPRAAIALSALIIAILCYIAISELAHRNFTISGWRGSLPTICLFSIHDSDPIQNVLAFENKLQPARFVHRNVSLEKPVYRNCGNSNWMKKGRRILINYASRCCRKSQPLNCETGLDKGGFDICIMFNETALDKDFRARNSKILVDNHGGGYWLWKPYIVFKTLMAMDEGDVLVYADSGSRFIDDFIGGPVCLLARNGGDIAVFTSEHQEREYSKADAFRLMNCLEEECYNGTQLTAAFLVFRKSIRSIQFVAHWLTYAQDRRIISDDPSRLEPSERPGFIAHRNDQSVISILSKKWKIEHWPDPSQWGQITEFGRRLRRDPRFSDILDKTFINHTRDKS